MNGREQSDEADGLAREVLEEVARARREFPVFNSPHEGYAVILEEVDELWDEVKCKERDYRGERMRGECIQIAAMALRFILECVPGQAGRADSGEKDEAWWRAAGAVMGEAGEESA